VHTLALAQHAIGDDDQSAPLSTPIQLLTDVSSIHCRRFQTLRFQTKYLPQLCDGVPKFDGRWATRCDICIQAVSGTHCRGRISPGGTGRDGR
jgi:hypothetical protein